MDNDIFEGIWMQLRSEAKIWWGKLTDDDLDKVDGKLDKSMGLVQDKYGYTIYQTAGGIRISKEDKVLD